MTDFSQTCICQRGLLVEKKTTCAVMEGENLHLQDETAQPGPPRAIPTPCSKIKGSFFFAANESHLALADNEQTQLHGNIRGDLSSECFTAPLKKKQKNPTRFPSALKSTFNSAHLPASLL